jgi:hypothetical protein
VKEPSATIKVYRAGNELLSVSWSDLISGSVPPISLQEGDTILVSVPTISGVVVAGAVSRPGTYDIKGNITVLGALALAGASVEPGETASSQSSKAGAGGFEGRLAGNIHADEGVDSTASTWRHGFS